MKVTVSTDNERPERWFLLRSGKTELPEDESEDLPDAVVKMSLRENGGRTNEGKNGWTHRTRCACTVGVYLFMTAYILD